jgi:hypothetical protein
VVRNAAIASNLALTAKRGGPVVRALEGQEVAVSLDLALVRRGLPSLAGGVMACGCMLWRGLEAWLVAGKFRRDSPPLTKGVSVRRGVRMDLGRGLGTLKLAKDSRFASRLVTDRRKVTKKSSSKTLKVW